MGRPTGAAASGRRLINAQRQLLNRVAAARAGPACHRETPRHPRQPVMMRPSSGRPGANQQDGPAYAPGRQRQPDPGPGVINLTDWLMDGKSYPVSRLPKELIVIMLILVQCACVLSAQLECMPPSDRSSAISLKFVSRTVAQVDQRWQLRRYRSGKTAEIHECAEPTRTRSRTSLVMASILTNGKGNFVASIRAGSAPAANRPPARSAGQSAPLNGPAAQAAS